jgi:formate hydrogenlyase subunit 3/multisubunit Na+/H+ antiporter MnhD subunit
MAAADNGGIKLILVMLTMAASSMLNALYFIRTLIRIYSPGDDREVRIPHRLDYNIPMFALTAGNLAMGLFSWIFVGAIQQGFTMFM